MSLLITNIDSLFQTEQNLRRRVAGKEMGIVPVLKDAFLLIEGDKIVDFGSMDVCPQRSGQVINAKGKLVFPCWCDSHTHLVYATSRENEFVDRIHGLSYEEIARRGGGILNSAVKLAETPEETLLESAWHRLEEIKDYGTGAVEIKSGYGLSLEAELKMLRVIRKLKSISDLSIKATFLGAHAIPLEYRDRRKDYITLLTEEMLPKVADEGLADYCDVFCDQGFFTPEETDVILNKANSLGLKPKIHANELGLTGGIQAGVRNGAISVDHLEHTGDDEINCLLNSETMSTLLPSTAFFLNIPYPPARKMIDSGLAVALASDYNPGSSPSGRMSFILSLACLKLGMTPEEAINAATINGAAAMELEQSHGSICRGKTANVFITRKIPSLAYIPYSFGSDLIETVIIRGSIQRS